MLTCSTLLTNEKRPCLSIAPWLLVVMQLGEPIVLPDQFVGPVVLVRDGSRTLGDRGYVPVVVVGVFVGVVAAILITSPRSSETVSISNEIVKKAATS